MRLKFEKEWNPFRHTATSPTTEQDEVRTKSKQVELFDSSRNHHTLNNGEPLKWEEKKKPYSMWKKKGDVPSQSFILVTDLLLLLILLLPSFPPFLSSLVFHRNRTWPYPFRSHFLNVSFFAASKPISWISLISLRISWWHTWHAWHMEQVYIIRNLKQNMIAGITATGEERREKEIW